MKVWVSSEQRRKIDHLTKKVLYSPDPGEFKRQLQFLMKEWLKHSGVYDYNHQAIEIEFERHATSEATRIFQDAKVGFVEYSIGGEFARAMDRLEEFVCLVEELILQGSYEVSVGEKIAHWKYGEGIIVNVRRTRIDVDFGHCGKKTLHLAFLEDIHFNSRRHPNA